MKIWLIVTLIGWVSPEPLPDEEKSAIKAIKAGDIALLNSYLDKQPDLNCRFSNGKTGLYYAIVFDQVKISAFLLKRGADPDFIADELTPLKWAIKYNRPRIVRFLIEYGADVNHADEKLETPLIYAAELNNMEICKILIDRGADPTRTNLKEKRAGDYAIYYKESPTHKYLLSVEKQYENQDSIPSMRDGPYIYMEADNQVVMTYFERNQGKNLTRLIEKTIETGTTDTTIEGIGWDSNSYHIQHNFLPNPDKLETDDDIFAIGDIHGRYAALVLLLRNNAIIDSSLNWIFDKGQLVLLGDVFDRGAMVTETLWFLYHLQIQARNSGGDVHLLLGNHEVMALTGDHRYLNDKYSYFTQYTWIYYFQLYANNTVLGNWLRSQNIIIRINDYLFMHAGISPEFAAFDYAYSDINTRVRNYLHSNQSHEKGSPEDIILGADGPLWYRGYMNPEKSMPAVTQQFVDDYLNSKDLKRMILGHNEQLSIKPLYEGKIIAADVALDESGRSAQGLLISGNGLFRCDSEGKRERIQ